MRTFGPSRGPVPGVKCQFCRTIFDRPEHLEPHVPAVACPSRDCQELALTRARLRTERARLPDLEPQRRLGLSREEIANRTRLGSPEILRPAVLNG